MIDGYDYYDLTDDEVRASDEELQAEKRQWDHDLEQAEQNRNAAPDRREACGPGPRIQSRQQQAGVQGQVAPDPGPVPDEPLPCHVCGAEGHRSTAHNQQLRRYE